jgi:hypothetical protein
MTKINNSRLFIAIILTLFSFSGCVSKYKGTKSHEYATLELTSQTKSALFANDYYAEIADYSKGCNNSESLGVVITDSDTKSKVVKIPVNKPLKIHVNYAHSSYDDISFILTPKQKTHYVVEYVQDDRQFYVYTKVGNKKLDIPDANIRMFHVRECL